MLIQSPRAGFPILPAPSSTRQPSGAAVALTVDAAIDLKIGQLLCARLCHDLIGPAAAISAGGELMLEEDASADDGADVRDLIVESGRQLAGRLAFFRTAFGPAGSRSCGLSRTQVRELAQGFLHGGRVQLDWQAADEPGDDRPLAADAVRVLLGLIMLAVDALPHGGRLVVSIRPQGADTCLSLTATGRSPRLGDELVTALRATEMKAVTPRTVHAFYLSRLAERLRASLVIESTAGDRLELRARVPQAGETQEKPEDDRPHNRRAAPCLAVTAA